MKLVVLGSGTSVPHPKRSSSAFWVETSGGSIILDCSPSAPLRMAQEDLDWTKLDAIWISHFHIDHCGGLGAFLFGTKYAPQTQTRRKPLRIIGPVGVKGLMERLDAVNDYRLLEQPFPVEITEIGPLEKIEILDGVEAVALKTPHTDESLAIQIRDGETTLVFSADTGPSLPLAAFANQADLFILECSFVKSKPVEKHLELAEAIYLIRKAKPRRAMLTHFYPEWDDVDFKDKLKKFEPTCEVIEAVDGLRIDLSE